jgi:hypothetical protein
MFVLQLSDLRFWSANMSKPLGRFGRGWKFNMRLTSDGFSKIILHVIRWKIHKRGFFLQDTKLSRFIKSCDVCYSNKQYSEKKWCTYRQKFVPSHWLEQLHQQNRVGLDNDRAILWVWWNLRHLHKYLKKSVKHSNSNYCRPNSFKSRKIFTLFLTCTNFRNWIYGSLYV